MHQSLLLNQVQQVTTQHITEWNIWMKNGAMSIWPMFHFDCHNNIDMFHLSKYSIERIFYIILVYSYRFWSGSIFFCSCWLNLSSIWHIINDNICIKITSVIDCRTWNKYSGTLFFWTLRLNQWIIVNKTHYWFINWLFIFDFEWSCNWSNNDRYNYYNCTETHENKVNERSLKRFLAQIFRFVKNKCLITCLFYSRTSRIKINAGFLLSDVIIHWFILKIEKFCVSFTHNSNEWQRLYSNWMINTNANLKMMKHNWAWACVSGM